METEKEKFRKSKVFIKHEAKVSSRVSGGERGVVDFSKLFTETNEQKFSVIRCHKAIHAIKQYKKYKAI